MKVFAIWLVAFGASLVASAQPRMMSIDARGSGELTVQMRAIPLREVRLQMNPDGMFRAELRADRTYQTSGRWSPGRSGVYNLQVERFDGRSATGSGAAQISGRLTLESLYLSGAAGPERFSVSFHQTDAGWGGSGGTGSWGGWGGSGGGGLNFSATRTGSGEFRHRGLRDSLERVTVRLSSNGTFSGEYVSSRDRGSFSGTYSRTRNDRVELDIRNFRGDGGASGRGYLILSGSNDFREIDMRGFTDREDFELIFRAGPGGFPQSEFRSSQSGSGTFRVSGERSRPVTSAEVVVDRFGNASVRLTAGGSQRFNGRVRSWRRDIIEIDIFDALGDRTARGRIRVQLSDRGGFTRLDVDGRARDRSFRADFRSFR